MIAKLRIVFIVPLFGPTHRGVIVPSVSRRFKTLGAAITLSPRPFPTSLLRIDFQSLPRVKASSMPIWDGAIYLIWCGLATVKIARRNQWWFSTSQSGAFGPEWDEGRVAQLASAVALFD
jgi:hypothetical protein